MSDEHDVFVPIPSGVEQMQREPAENAGSSRRRHVDEDEENFIHFAQQFNSVLKPVAVTMVLLVFVVFQLKAEATITGGPGQSYDAILAYQESSNDSTGTKLKGALLNALIFVGMILGITILFVILYKYRCLKAIYAWLIFSCVSLMGFFGGMTVYQLLDLHDMPIDWISFVFVLYNFSVVGVIVIFWRGPMLLQQTYLVLISVLLAVNLNNLPEWTTWALLAAVSVYDLFAVLAPRGPLKVLVETAQERKEPIPGLIYQAPTVKLGLGDFIFYSVLVGRGAVEHDMTIVSATFVAVLFGLSLTLLLLAVFKKALPALPISIALGIVFFFIGKYALVPYIYYLNEHQIYLL